jgi:hypothetical protein
VEAVQRAVRVRPVAPVVQADPEECRAQAVVAARVDPEGCQEQVATAVRAEWVARVAPAAAHAKVSPT